MHDQREPLEGEVLPPEPAEPARARPKSAWGTTGAGVAGIALLLAKFKGALALLAGLKWLILVPKLLASFGTLFLSIWFYALFFGWKFGIVFVLLILVHELGHYITFRNFGIAASLPFFIPGFGAFVATRGPAPSLTIDAIATLAGPVFGIAAAAICYGYGVATAQPFWYAAAYVGFFLNALNLIPVPPFDGGRIAAAIEPRLWVVGGALLLAAVVLFDLWSPFMVLILVLVAFAAIPRIAALRRGEVDPRFFTVTRAARIGLAAAYFVTFALAAGGAAASHIRTPNGGGFS